MPYFNIRIAQEVYSDYIVTAPNRETAEDIALMADASKKYDSNKIFHLGTNSHAAISITDTDKPEWDTHAERTKEQ